MTQQLIAAHLAWMGAGAVWLAYGLVWWSRAHRSPNRTDADSIVRFSSDLRRSGYFLALTGIGLLAIVTLFAPAEPSDWFWALLEGIALVGLIPLLGLYMILGNARYNSNGIEAISPLACHVLSTGRR